jgi:hypothetical protein
MSYTYPEALAAFESIANEYLKVMRPNERARAHVICDVHATTASVSWDVYAVRINMPVRDASSRMTQTEFENWTAYLLHELGHPTHTDLSVWRDAVRLGHSNLVNALEDVRMEKAVIASNVAPNAKAVLSRLISRKVAEARATGWKPNARKEIAWTLCVIGRAANGYDLDAADLDWLNSQIKPGSTVETVLAWALPKLAACTSTADCLELAKLIAAAIAAPLPGDDNEIQPGKGESRPKDGEGEGESRPKDGEGEGEQGEGEQGEGEQGEGEGEGEGGKGKGEGEKRTGDVPSKPEAPSEGEGEGEGGKGGKGHGNKTTDDGDETPVTSDGELATRDLAPEGETFNGGTKAGAEKALIDILRSDVMASKPRDAGATPARIGAPAARLQNVAAQASKQRALLARALRANETDDREGGRKAGRLDSRALSRAMAGAENVFMRRDISEGYDTDVCVLLDASGSMGGGNMTAALEMGLIIAQAASSVGAACTTEVFNSTGYIRAGSLAGKRAPNPAEYGRLTNAARGGTPLSAHMARAGVAQHKRAPGKRRVLFILTDGGCDWGPDVVKRAATYLEKTCSTVLAHVSIGTPLMGAFKAEVCVPNGQPLSELGLEHFVKVLRTL